MVNGIRNTFISTSVLFLESKSLFAPFCFFCVVFCKCVIMFFFFWRFNSIVEAINRAVLWRHYIIIVAVIFIWSVYMIIRSACRLLTVLNPLFLRLSVVINSKIFLKEFFFSNIVFFDFIVILLSQLFVRFGVIVNKTKLILFKLGKLLVSFHFRKGSFYVFNIIERIRIEQKPVVYTIAVNVPAFSKSLYSAFRNICYTSRN